MIWYILIGIVIGAIFASALFFGMFFERYSDYGGTILIDDERMVNRLYLNNSMDDWAKQKFIIFKVAKAEQPLKRLKDVDDMSLEESNEDI